jgi:hypothetical protein
MQSTPQQNQATQTVSASLPLVFILGNSYSGSTLLGFLLSSSPEVVFLGEIKSKNWNPGKMCSCGMVSGSCPFYGHDFEVLNQLRIDAIQSVRHLSPLYFLFFRKKKISTGQQKRLNDLRENINTRILQLYPETAYWTDSSKSLWMLNAWLQTIGPDNIKIIWLKRSLRANVASFIKRGASFWPSLMGAILNSKLTGVFLRRNRLTHLVVEYDQFYDHFSQQAGSISDFLGVQIGFPEIPFQHHHVISGNRSTRSTFTEVFQGFRKDDEWKKVLTGFQQKIVSWIS